jgi:hypothetical protein
MKISERELTVMAVSSSLALVLSLTLIWHATDLFLDDHKYAAVMNAGLAFIIWGGCFDPINFLWLCLPFAFKRVFSSNKFDVAGPSFLHLGLLLVLYGLIKDEWLFHPSPPPSPY